MSTAISAAELARRKNAGEAIELIDVRSPAEFRSLHVEFARNVPLDQLDPAAIVKGRGATAGQPLYVICRSGARSQTACDKIVQAGFGNVVNILDGTLAAEKAGLPVVHGTAALSLERQVRIAAGALMLTGIALSFWHPWFLGISAFVAAGLIFSGITGFCGLGLLLARLPWNRP